MATGLTLETTFPVSWHTSESEQFFVSGDQYPRGRKADIRFWVQRQDGDTWVDLAPYLTEATVDLGAVTRYGDTTGVDNPSRLATFKLAADRQMIPVWPDTTTQSDDHVVGDDETVIGAETQSLRRFINLLWDTDNTWRGDSFHPLDRRSRWNEWAGAYSRLLKSRRRCRIEVAFSPITASGPESPSEFDYICWFDGYMGDDISNEGSQITVLKCHDESKLLKECLITTSREYSGPAEDVIRAILTDNGWEHVANAMWVPVSPGIELKPYIVEYVTVWDAIQQIATEIAWFLGYRRRPSTNDFALTLMDPPRAKDADSANFTLSISDVIRDQNLSIRDVSVRNRVELTFRDQEEGSATEGELVTVSAEDDESIEDLRLPGRPRQTGIRAFQIIEDETSLIWRSQDALFASLRLLHDLVHDRATTTLKCRMLPTMDIFAGVTVDDRRLSSTQDFYGVESVQQRIVISPNDRGSTFETAVVASGSVIGGYQRWLEREAVRGAKRPLLPEESVGAGRIMPKPESVSCRGIIRGVAVDVPVPAVNANRWAETEIHLSTTDGFTPSSATRVDGGRQTHFELTDDGASALVSGTTYYARAGYRDVRGNISAYSDQVSSVAGRVERSDVDTDQLIQLSGVVGGENRTLSAGNIVLVQEIDIAVPDGTSLILRRARYRLHDTELRLRFRLASSIFWTSADYRGEEAPDQTLYTNSSGSSQTVSLEVQIENTDTGNQRGLFASDGWWFDFGID